MYIILRIEHLIKLTNYGTFETLKVVVFLLLLQVLGDVAVLHLKKNSDCI